MPQQISDLNSKKWLLLFLTDFRRYTSSDSHFMLMMSYDVTGGGPMEAAIVELSVPALK